MFSERRYLIIGQQLSADNFLLTNAATYRDQIAALLHMDDGHVRPSRSPLASPYTPLSCEATRVCSQSPSFPYAHKVRQTSVASTSLQPCISGAVQQSRSRLV